MKTLYFVVFLAALGGLLSGFDTGVISGALLYINNEWKLTELMQGFLVSSVLIGALAGAAINGRFVDIFGRKYVILATAVIFFTGSILCAAAPDIYILILSRFIVGFAIGIIDFCAPLYLSEIAPEKIRGALVSLFQLAITAGILISYLVNALSAQFFESWRIMFAAGTIPAVILAAGIYFMPDTPRWYVLKGRFKEASETLSKLRPDINAEKEIENIKSIIYKQNTKEKFKFENWMKLPLIICMGCMFIQQWSGINTIIYYAPVILKHAGFNDNLTAIYATGGIGIVNFLMTFIAIFLTDKLGRKPLLYIGLTGIGFCLVLFALSFDNIAFLGNFSKYCALISAALYITFFAFSLGPVIFVISTEVSPLKIRGVMMSFAITANFAFNFIISLLFLPMLKTFGEFNTFMLFALISFAGIIFVRFVIPETKGISLEEIERSWKKTDAETL